jgi:phosphatidylinositol dimannoside acyltransferase
LTVRSEWAQSLVDQAFRGAWAVTRHLPESFVQPALDRAADRVWRQGGAGVTQLEANLRRAVPAGSDDALRSLTRRAVRSYFRYWHEVFAMPSWSRRRIVDTVVTTNESSLRSVLARGRGSIVALCHMGNWDLAGGWACLTGLPVATIAERLRPEALYNRFVAFRTQLGFEVAPLSAGDNPLTVMRRALERGRVVCLLADRAVGPGGVEVSLLGEPARLPSGVASLSRLSGVPIVVAISSYHGPLMRLDISDPIDPVPGKGGVVQMTQQVADLFTAGIRGAPQDWHMMQPVFVADLAAGRR